MGGLKISLRAWEHLHTQVTWTCMCELGVTSLADTRRSSEPARAATLLCQVPSRRTRPAVLTGLLCSFAQNWCDKNRQKAEEQVPFPPGASSIL